MLNLKVISGLAAVALLAGCYGTDVDNLRNAQATGSPFTQALTAEYKEFSAFEADEMYDWPDAAHFARKGLVTAGGGIVEPEPLENWDLPADHVDELAAARARLVDLLNRTAREKVPEAAARAQGQFECWIEQQEENHQPDDIQACREAFYLALADVEMAMGDWIVYFDLNSDTLDMDAEHRVHNIGVTLNATSRGVSVTGHADRSGSAAYNLGLSLRRANAVRDALMSEGVAPDVIGVAARGESEPAVWTPNGVPEAANRRVELMLQ
jgi:OOP family OmpA-OmpF porin